MNPYKDYHEVVYLEVILPLEYEPMMDLWDISGCFLLDSEEEIVTN